ncbi:MAG TPA: RNA polymerase sigma factor [Spirochaetia bacterium]|nr:RNA polymerase sigma factor [Spirochaetia bacterium]
MSSTEYAHPPPFDVVYEQLFPIIYRVSLRVTGDREVAEDLCHDAFIKLMERSDLLADVEQCKYWLIRVVKNLSLNYEKRRGRERAAYSKYSRFSTPAAESGETRMMDEQTRTDVQHALNSLPYNLRVPLVFREYGELSYREIGTILGISESNVKVRIFRARERLGKVLSEGDEHVS